jgi:hypothetical protein
MVIGVGAQKAGTAWLHPASKVHVEFFERLFTPEATSRLFGGPGRRA